MAHKSTKARSKNFTGSEVNVLVREVEKRRHLLFGPLKGPALTQFHRDRAWEKVVEAINMVSPVHRGMAEIKKKFRDLKTRTKRKATAFKRQARRTGENEVNPLSAAEERLITSFIGQDSIEGVKVKDEVDTCDEKVCNLPSTCAHTPTISELLLETCGTPEKVFLPSCSPVSTSQSPTPLQSSAPVSSAHRTAMLREEHNTVLHQLLNEFRDFKEQITHEIRDFKQQFLEMKKRELDILEDDASARKRRTSS